MDALQSFTHLTDNIPSWLSDLDDVVQQIKTYQTEISNVAKRSDRDDANNDGADIVSIKSKAKSQMGSNTSVMPIEEGDNIERPTAFAKAQAAQNPSSQPWPSSQTPRKRKTDSVLSGPRQDSLPLRRKSVVVYYDSTIQSSFEALVRDISVARNNLRKGKMAARMKQLTSSMANDFSGRPSFPNRRGPPMGPKLGYARAGRDSQSPGSFGGQAPGSPFDEADKGLERAQNLTEVAAHQFLREGDCGPEMDGIKEGLEEASHVAEKEVKRLREEEEKEQEMERRRAHTRQTDQIEADDEDTGSESDGSG
ncbi:hypothetical protein L228DRAFT_246067 [Xylona heveae TC161]|uniref:Uncharacterized protein n=1 Tax=Xylona heveae (strain CBS 132557 / TC161) TaxID=1328760 RepID=A0A165HCP4_XYLHT|nr:hypothetical protein L228DRAFT_246067 [Xylona heveae TC161]KZF23309.1 hypothetical protein L228DRAFT_246067 [Xylona heveae TC161]